MDLHPEQIVESHHRASVAREAVEGFRRELSDDRDLVNVVLEAIPELRGRIHAQLDLLNTNPLPFSLNISGQEVLKAANAALR